MSRPKTRRKKRKIKVRSKVHVARKGNMRNDSLSSAPTKLVDDNGTNFKIKIRRR